MAYFSAHDPNDPAFNSDDPAAKSAMQQMFGPGHVDHVIRQAIQFCWMGMPDDRRNVDEVESQIRRLVDRALRDMREDADAFGLGK